MHSHHNPTSMSGCWMCQWVTPHFCRKIMFSLHLQFWTQLQKRAPWVMDGWKLFKHPSSVFTEATTVFFICFSPVSYTRNTLGIDVHQGTWAAGMRSWKVLLVFRCPADVSDAAGAAELLPPASAAEQEPGTAARISCLWAQHIGLCCPSCCPSLASSCFWKETDGILRALGDGASPSLVSACPAPEGPAQRDLMRGWKRNSQWLGQDWEFSAPHIYTTVNNTDGVSTKAGKCLIVPFKPQVCIWSKMLRNTRS